MEIIYSKQAVKYLNSLDRKTRIRIKEAIETIPWLDRDLKIQGVKNLSKLRVGNLRVLYERNSAIIYITLIMSRGQIYKRL